TTDSSILRSTKWWRPSSIFFERSPSSTSGLEPGSVTTGSATAGTQARRRTMPQVRIRFIPRTISGFLLLPDQSFEEPGRLVADHVVAGRVGVVVGEPAGQVAEMGVEPVVHHHDSAAPDERLDPAAIPLRDLLQRVATIVEHVPPVRELRPVAR